MIHEEIRLINKILQIGNLTELEKLKISDDFLRLNEAKEALIFIRNYSKHVNTLGYVPSIDIFRKRFPNFHILDEVNEPIPILASEIRNEYMRRQLEEIIANVDVMRLTDPYEALNFIQSNASLMMSQHTSNSQVYNLKDSGKMLKEMYQSFKVNKGMIGIPWPWPSLNKETHGMQGGQWIVLYGRPKSGKTTITTGAMANVFKNFNKRIGIFNFEDDEKDLMMLFTCFLCNVDYLLCKDGKLNPADDARYMATCDELHTYDGKDGSKLFFVEQCKGSDLNHIKARIEEFSLDIAVINGVYFVKDYGSKKTDMDWKVMTNLSRNAKQIARELNVTIIGITQANRQAGEVAYADAFEQDCDALIKVTPHVFEDAIRGSKFELQCVRGGGSPVEFYINSRPGLENSERVGIQVVQEQGQPQQSRNNFFSAGAKIPLFSNGKR